MYKVWQPSLTSELGPFHTTIRRTVIVSPPRSGRRRTLATSPLAPPIPPLSHPLSLLPSLVAVPDISPSLLLTLGLLNGSSSRHRQAGGILQGERGSAQQAVAEEEERDKTKEERMVSLLTWFRYATHKFEYSISLSWKKYNVGQINSTELTDAIWKSFFQGKLTFAHWTKGGEAMAPIMSATGGTLLVRKLATLTPKEVFVGDIVLLKDPEKSDDLIVRRLAALDGYEMVSTDEKDEPFVLDKDQCWVLADNESLKPKEARDSRLFGPVPMTDIVGRVIYSLRTAVDHGPVDNSRMAMSQDSPVLAVELDVEEMAKNNKM